MKEKLVDLILRIYNKARMEVMPVSGIMLAPEDYKPFPGDSVVSINHTCLEVVDYRYSQKGEMGFWLMVSLPILLRIIVAGSYHSYLFLDYVEYSAVIRYSVFTFFSLLSLTCLAGFFLIMYLSRVEFRDLDIRRVRFNRKNKCVYFMDRGGQLQQYKWNDLQIEYSTVSANTNVHGQLDFFRKDDDERYDPLFILGFYQDKYITLCYYEFIRCYMEEDVVEDLAELVSALEYIPKLDEEFIDGFAQLVRNYVSSRWKLVWLPVLWPYTFISACWRWVGMRTCRKFVWPEEVDRICAPEADDPVQVDISICPNDRLGHAFLSYPKDYYIEMNVRIRAAHENIINKLLLKYG